jgi:catechol 2,3-dioxygenase-like lactoylglutathione lyase family enzyme
MTFTLHGICPLLQAFDMAAALRFYRDVLGPTVIRGEEAIIPAPRSGDHHGAAQTARPD